MTIRVLAGAFWLLILALPAAAQWQPLDGGANTTAAPPSPPCSGCGSSTGDGIQGWSATPSYGSPATPPPTTAPATGATPPPPAVAPAVTITYSGQAAADPRRATMKLRIVGTQMTAHVSMQSICAPNVHVGGADINLVGGVNGQWESAGAAISGTWTGVDHHCGTDDPNQGQFSFFLKDIGMGRKVLHLRVSGKNGTYGWNFTPTGKVYTGGGGKTVSTPTPRRFD